MLASATLAIANAMGAYVTESAVFAAMVADVVWAFAVIRVAAIRWGPQ